MSKAKFNSPLGLFHNHRSNGSKYGDIGVDFGRYGSISGGPWECSVNKNHWSDTLRVNRSIDGEHRRFNTFVITNAGIHVISYRFKGTAQRSVVAFHDSN